MKLSKNKTMKLYSKISNTNLEDPNSIKDMGMTLVYLQSLQISLNVDKCTSLHEVPFDPKPIGYHILMVPLITSLCVKDIPSSPNPLNPPYHFGL